MYLETSLTGARTSYILTVCLVGRIRVDVTVSMSRYFHFAALLACSILFIILLDTQSLRLHFFHTFARPWTGQENIMAVCSSKNSRNLPPCFAPRPLTTSLLSATRRKGRNLNLLQFMNQTFWFIETFTKIHIVVLISFIPINSQSGCNPKQMNHAHPNTRQKGQNMWGLKSVNKIMQNPTKIVFSSNYTKLWQKYFWFSITRGKKNNIWPIVA